MNSTDGQYVEPQVSQLKFEREVSEYRQFDSNYRLRGWFMTKAEWPLVEVILASNKTTPPTIVIAVRFDYTNYDAEPPSVRLIEPFSGRPLLANELTVPAKLLRSVPGPVVPVGVPNGDQVIEGRLVAKNLQPLMQFHVEDEPPFLCIAGVREYHNHPGHSGDPWELHKANGAGKLVRLLEAIAKYGLDTVRGLDVRLEPTVTFATSEPPP